MSSSLITILNIYLIVSVHLIKCQRRILNGERVDKNYVVYIISEKSLAGWTCGGAILHPSYVITSRACVAFKNSEGWVISGYNRHVNVDQIDKDECTSRIKERIDKYYISRCHSPSNNETNINRIIWAYAGVGIVKLLKPLDFNAAAYLQYCSYKPGTIKISYKEQSHKPGVDAAVFGWGSHKYYRPVNSTVNLDSEYLMGSSVALMDTEECRKIYREAYSDGPMITAAHLCTQKAGNVDMNGKYLGTRRDNSNKTYRSRNLTIEDFLVNGTKNGRRNGICQNDIGTPLVTWMEGVEHLIGIAAGFLVTERMECIGPFQFVGVALFAKFINCTMSQKTRRGNAGCQECGFPNSTHEATHINWEEELASLYDFNETEVKSQEYWPFSDEEEEQDTLTLK